jgi:hypothetical protein
MLAEMLIAEALKSGRGEYGRLFLIDENSETLLTIDGGDGERPFEQLGLTLPELQALLADGQPKQKQCKDEGMLLLLPLQMHEHAIGCLLIGRRQNQPFDQLIGNCLPGWRTSAASLFSAFPGERIWNGILPSGI